MHRGTDAQKHVPMAGTAGRWWRDDRRVTARGRVAAGGQVGPVGFRSTMRDGPCPGRKGRPPGRPPGLDAPCPPTHPRACPLRRLAPHAHLYAASAGVDPVESFTDPASYEAVTDSIRYLALHDDGERSVMTLYGPAGRAVRGR